MSSEQGSQDTNLTPTIKSLLGRLRWSIRAYVLIEGISLAIVWLCATFWIGLALDYLPVLVGANEMPRGARFVLLVVIAGVLAAILFFWVFRRAFLEFRDRSMALLLERKFDLKDSLVTSVEMSEAPDHAEQFNETMLTNTTKDAEDAARKVSVSGVFNFFPLMRNLGFAVLLLGTVGLFYSFNAPAFARIVDRLYLLGDEPWPRSANISVVGVKPIRLDENMSATPTEMRKFEGKIANVARGASVSLWVKSDSQFEIVPDFCTVFYRTSDNERGRFHMSKKGRLVDGFQMYSYEGKPLQRMTETIEFSVLGADHHVTGFKISVVENPAVIKTYLRCKYPSYLEQENEEIPLTPGMRIPYGTDVELICTANKAIEQVIATLPQSTMVQDGEEAVREAQTLDTTIDGKTFICPLGVVTDTVTVDFALIDGDGVNSQQTHRVYVAVNDDDAPKLETRLRGIGIAVTPDVIIPATGTVSDDYGVKKVWFDLQLTNAEGNSIGNRKTDISRNTRTNEVDGSIDFRELRTAEENALEIRQSDRAIVTIKASDYCDLLENENIGSSDQITLEVVTPDRLLTILEAQEIALRRRFEQIVDEATAVRDDLLHVKADFDPAPKDPGVEPDNLGEEKLTDEEKEQRRRSLRLLRVQNGWQQSQKLSQEVLGVSVSFLDIREEIINNRVDTEDRKERLKVKVADPLDNVATIMFPELDARLKKLEELLDDADQNRQAADDAVEQANNVVAELERILQDMLDIETYNELVDIVRSIIEDQKELAEETRKARLKGLLED